jgi:uncharacterized protein (TIGR03435 family)
MTVETLIGFAYEIRDSQIIGGPKWLATDGYDIVGKAEGTVSSNDQVKLLFQSLLTDRFKLALHYETREGPVYALTLAKGGLKLQHTKEGSCTIFEPNKPQQLAPNQPPPKFCGSIQQRAGGPSGTLNAIGIGITKLPGSSEDLITALSRIVDRTVVDGTGITGMFDVHLEWTPDQTGGEILVSPASGDPAASPPSDNGGPSIFYRFTGTTRADARIDSGPVRVLVIDHVERTSEN